MTTAVAIGRRGAAAVLLLALTACAEPLPPADFAGDAPAFAPDRWFEGRTSSVGVFEDRAGAPIGRFSVHGEGTRAANGTLTLRQRIEIVGEEPFERVWSLRVQQDGRTVATGPAIRGEGVGAVHGPVWHLRYTETLPPGGWLRTVRFEHWMYLAPGGEALVNRFTIRKLGLVVARATEIFRRAPDDAER